MKYNGEKQMKLTDFLKGLSFVAVISAFALPTYVSASASDSEGEEDAVEWPKVLVEGDSVFGHVSITEAEDGDRLFHLFRTHRIAQGDPIVV